MGESYHWQASRPPAKSRAPGRIDTTQRTAYLHALQDWNGRLLDHLRFIRILEAVRWRDEVEHDFFAGGCRELPRIGLPDYRQAIPFLDLPDRLFDLRSLEKEIARRLGPDSPAARLLMRHVRSAQDALRLIAARGTSEFVWLSREIYGSSYTSKTSRDRLMRLIAWFEGSAEPVAGENRLDAESAAEELRQRLQSYCSGMPIHVRVADSLSADASAGCGYLKIRRGATFTPSDIDLLEAHEGWVHLGTMINGSRQPLVTSLSKCTPCTTAIQEGLAIFTELAAGCCHAQRRRKLARRLRAVIMAEDGADFLQVFQFFRAHDVCERQAYQQTARVFRGSLPGGVGPFTKDLSYGLGLLDVAAHLRSRDDEDGRAIPLLFAGKTCLDDIPDLAQIHEVGLLIPGELIPPPLRDRRRVRRTLLDLAAW
jgi:uncharacterized protein (TIGR02421 family)